MVPPLGPVSAAIGSHACFWVRTEEGLFDIRRHVAWTDFAVCPKLRLVF